jgi:hypothetical protein
MNAESELLDLIRELRDTQRAHYEAYLKFTNAIEARSEEAQASSAEGLRSAGVNRPTT